MTISIYLNSYEMDIINNFKNSDNMTTSGVIRRALKLLSCQEQKPGKEI